jgi:ABC-2 type transport system permease protein
MSGLESAPPGRKAWIVARHEITSTVLRRSFWLTTFLFPLFVLVLSLGSQLFAPSGDGLGEVPFTDPGASGTVTPIGYVDEGGLLTLLPPDMPAGALVSYPSATDANEALTEGHIDTYYSIPADYVSAGILHRVDRKPPPTASSEVDPLMLYALSYSLTGDTTTSQLLFDPLARMKSLPQTPEAQVRPEGPLAFFVPYATMLIFYFVLVMSSGYMLQSVTKEKENRTAEVLLLSVKPRELMLGKVTGLCAVALLQMAVWLGGGLLVLRNAQTLFGLDAGLAYFLLGFFTYASLYAAVGVLAPSTREANQYVIAVMAPLIVPLFFINVFINSPGGGLATALSLFPLTAPVSMVTRMAAVSVPLWQLLLGVALLAACAYGIVLLAARFFRADALLSHRSLSWRRLGEELARRH